ncbi:hypothetical protein ABK040_001423 [Willaertia magna]
MSQQQTGVYGIDGNTPDANQYVLHLTIPDNVLSEITQNPNSVKLRFLSDPVNPKFNFELKFNNNQKMNLDATERSATDLYCFENNFYHQIGTIKHKVHLNLGMLKTDTNSGSSMMMMDGDVVGGRKRNLPPIQTPKKELGSVTGKRKLPDKIGGSAKLSIDPIAGKFKRLGNDSPIGKKRSESSTSVTSNTSINNTTTTPITNLNTNLNNNNITSNSGITNSVNLNENKENSNGNSMIMNNAIMPESPSADNFSPSPVSSPNSTSSNSPTTSNVSILNNTTTSSMNTTINLNHNTNAMNNNNNGQQQQRDRNLQNRPPRYKKDNSTRNNNSSDRNTNNNNRNNKNRTIQQPQPQINSLTLKIGNEEYPLTSLVLMAIQKGIKDLNNPSLNISTLTKIENIEQYNQLKKEFNEKYIQYKEIDKILNQNIDDFKKWSSEWKNLQNGKEREDVNTKIQQIFTRRREDAKILTRKFNALHKELEQLKKLITDYISVTK